MLSRLGSLGIQSFWVWRVFGTSGFRYVEFLVFRVLGI